MTREEITVGQQLHHLGLVFRVDSIGHITLRGKLQWAAWSLRHGWVPIAELEPAPATAQEVGKPIHEKRKTIHRGGRGGR